MHTTAPVAKAVRVGSGLRILSCPFCHKEHWHGGDAGHRETHCVDPRPDAYLGYIVIVVEPADMPAGER